MKEINRAYWCIKTDLIIFSKRNIENCILFIRLFFNCHDGNIQDLLMSWIRFCLYFRIIKKYRKNAEQLNSSLNVTKEITEIIDTFIWIWLYFQRRKKYWKIKHYWQLNLSIIGMKEINRAYQGKWPWGILMPWFLFDYPEQNFAAGLRYASGWNIDLGM